MRDDVPNSLSPSGLFSTRRIRQLIQVTQCYELFDAVFYIAGLCRAVLKSGCNLQDDITRFAFPDLVINGFELTVAEGLAAHPMKDRGTNSKAFTGERYHFAGRLRIKR